MYHVFSSEILHCVTDLHRVGETTLDRDPLNYPFYALAITSGKYTHVQS